ncbi:peptidylprolyl isomerase [Lewinella sp. IMCC34191]|uniref:peptidylprolyl isomerase n=1 Tax=Lewinella sp. IMCC34191 TaxID=2259172 RepID=UPI0018E53BF0|nr:peptidylprolyl isomerase [Lewinella sp. IMCC34191]
MLYRFVAAIVLGLGLLACIPPSEETEEQPVVVDYQDPVVKRLYELQNDRAEDSLRAYLNAPQVTYRYLAARALGSFPRLSPATIDSLAARLSDESAVRTQAAYALGQTESERAGGILAGAFDRSGNYLDYNAAVLAAVGKTATEKQARQLAGITTYTVQDTALMAGRLWGLYYAALRGYHGPEADRAVLDVIRDPAAAPALRLPAAHYLFRIEVPLDTATEAELMDMLRRETDADVAMGIIRSVGRSGNASARAGLLRQYEQTDDWRQRVEVLHAFQSYEYTTVRESVLEALRDPHPLVARTAAEFLLDQGIPADAPLYIQMAQDDLPHELSTLLYRAANRHLALYLTDYRDRINNELRARYVAATDPYEKAEILRALGEFPWMYRIVYTYYRDSEEPVVRTVAAETLQAISDREDFAEFFRGSSRRVRADLGRYFQEMMESGEDGPVYHAAQAVAANPDAYQSMNQQRAWIDDALNGLQLPRQVEAYREIFTARNALRGTDTALPELTTNDVRALDWEVVAAEDDPTVSIATPEGDIRLRLWPREAPETTGSFLQLVEEGYYDGKHFHRVVPNFVAQGGGPRGDGFGAEDFSLRTETPGLHWDRPGLVGMASAGKDTEGVQFFITHRATPHLDGKYTIFGEVVEGQEVVDRLVPGSPINRISRR